MGNATIVKKRNEQTICLTILSIAITFTVCRDKYNEFVNALSVPGKRNIAQLNHNFLVKCVHEDCKEQLVNILDENPGSETEITGAVIEQYIPDLGIVAKKLLT